MSEHAPLVAAEALTIPVDQGIELRLVGEEMRPELFALIVKNRRHLSPWVSWARTLDTETDKITGWLINATSYLMGIFVEGQLSGMVDIRDLRNPEGAEVGVWVDEDHTGQALATRSLAELIDFARSRHPIKRIRYNTYENNDASSGVAVSLGFRHTSTGINEEARREKRYVKEYDEAKEA